MLQPTFFRNLLIALLLLQGISAMGGGAMLILSPTGALLGGLPLSLLTNSPFVDFLLPGIILFVVLGLIPTVLCIALVKKPSVRVFDYLNVYKDMHWAWTFTIYIAFALIIWIQVETIIFQGTSWLQTIYLLYSIPIILVALLPSVRANYKIHP